MCTSPTATWGTFTAQWAEFAPFCEDLRVPGTLSAMEDVLGVVVALESWRWMTATFRASWWYMFCIYALLQR